LSLQFLRGVLVKSCEVRRVFKHGSLLLAGVVALVACRAHKDTLPASPAPLATPSSPVILFLGTSLTAGYGLEPEQAFPALIQERLDSEGLRYRVVNAGVSGETSAGALRRVDWLLRQPLAVLVVETGANDGLRGEDTDALRSNLQAIIEKARQASPPPKLLLLGMEAPPNLGAQYGSRFRALYAELARTSGVAFVPFLLEGVAGFPSLNQSDGIHPTAQGQARVAHIVWMALRPLLVPEHRG
jgi:acyl-CoA thioesterase-1